MALSQPSEAVGTNLSYALYSCSGLSCCAPVAHTMLSLLIFALLALKSMAWNRFGSLPRSFRAVQTGALQQVGGAAAIAAGVLLTGSKSVNAAAGAVQKATAEESLTAGRAIVNLAAKCDELDALAAKSDWEAMGKLLSDPLFVQFDKTAGVLTRSDALSAEDKIALGTIKRYGITADVIIMIGGLGGVLRAGGVKSMAVATGGYADQKAIEEDNGDDDEGGEEGSTEVNAEEARKYAKLVKGSVNDILRIVKASSIKI